MADISTFELLVKRIAPVEDPTNVFNAPFRRTVQSYFLTISNPNETPVFLRMRARFSALEPISRDSIRDRELIGRFFPNHNYIYDITGGPNRGQRIFSPLRCKGYDFNGNQGTMISDNLFLPAGVTATFIIAPNLEPSGLINLANPNLEIRGYIEAVQLRRFIGIINNDGTITFVLAGSNDIDLYFTPEHRSIVLDNSYPDFSGQANLDFDQGAYALPTTTGSARIRLQEGTEPFSVFCFLFPGGLDITDLTARVDASDRILLDDKALKFLEGKVGETNKANPEMKLTLGMVRDQLEQELNQLVTLERDSKKAK